MAKEKIISCKGDLDLWDRALVSDDIPNIVEFIKTSPGLTEINLGRNNLLECDFIKVIGAVIANETISRINVDFSQNFLTDEGLSEGLDLLKGSHISGLGLNIRYNFISDAGMEVLSFLIQENSIPLTFLDVSSSSEAIENDKKIEGITESGWSSFFAALKKNNTIESLEISNNLFSDENLREFSEALQVNSTIKEITFYNAPSDKKGIIWEGVKNNTSLVSFKMLGEFQAQYETEYDRSIAEYVQMNAMGYVTEAVSDF